MRRPNLPTIAGLLLTITGLAHFVVPDQIVPMVAPAFPTNTRRHVLINGGLETGLGALLMSGRTRRAAIVGILLYLGYMTASALRNK
jgi:uncharacterized membrane protein